MNKKFLIFMNRKFEFSIYLAMVNFHKDIKVPSDAVVRCGGGWWSLEHTGTLRLYGESDDFSRYDEAQAQKAFDAKRVFYFGEECMEDFEIKNIQLD